MTSAPLAVVGAGAWGTALANVLGRRDRRVILWGRGEAAMTAMAEARQNPRLPGAALAAGVHPTSEMAEVAEAAAILLAVPAQELRAVARLLAPMFPNGLPVVACAKGIERGTHRFMTEVIAEAMPGALPAILSGPSFAADVARGLPTAVTLAAPDEAEAQRLTAAFSTPHFRVYHSTDVRGVEIGGAAKNVLAIAAGIVQGRRLGASAAAALTTRGFAELVRFGRAFGARTETLTGLSGLGDLLLTCSTTQSRNYSFGIAIGEGRPAESDKLAEGAFTASVLVEIARERALDVPIANAVAAVIEGRWSVDDAITSLLTRPLRAEA